MPAPRHRPAAGFTLVEVLLVMVIVLLVLTGFIAALTRATDRSRAAVLMAAASQARSAVQSFAEAHASVLPITETVSAGGIPVTGALASAAPIGALSAAATFDAVLFSSGHLGKPLQFSFGGLTAPVNPTAAPLLWNDSTGRFYMAPDAPPSRDYSLCNRLETVIAERGTPYDFTLDGTNFLPAGRIIIVLVVPRCPAAIAYNLSLLVDSPARSSSENAADTVGAVLYAAPSAGVTTVYLYVYDL